MKFKTRPVLYILLLALTFSFVSYNNSYSGGLVLPLSETDTNVYQLYSFYDLRDRESFVQVTSPDSAVTVHFQVFDVSNLCTENNFFDSYTTADTHVYNMRDILTNNGNDSGVELPDGAYGFVVVTAVLAQGQPADTDANIIGNFRIIDNTGYEYRTNSQDATIITDTGGRQFTFNFNQPGGVNAADVIGITVNNIDSGEVTAADTSLTFNTTLYNDSEVPFSCSDTTFSCTENTFEYGINNSIPNSRDGSVVCDSNNIDEGFVDLELILDNPTNGFVGYVGLNNSSGRGSMDSMWTESSQELTMLSQICSDGIDNNDNGFTDCMDQACDGTVVDTGGGEFTCESSSEMICDDNFDNNENGFTDCADIGCDGSIVDTGGGDFECEPTGETSCDDGFDNDRNGLTDCADPNCENLDICGCGGDGQCTVFVDTTTPSLANDFGPLSVADARCQATADTAGLPGTYMAWISNDTESPSTRFNQAPLPYVRVDGTTVIASNYTDLTDGTLQAAIFLDQNGNDTIITDSVMTGTNADGTPTTVNCSNWTVNDDSANFIIGVAFSAVSSWTNFDTFDCSITGNFVYCFEQ